MKKEKTENSQIGPYNIIKSLAKGGMGEVFLVYDNKCKRVIALKKIRDDLKDNLKVKQRFVREAKIASTLSHPSIIPIYDFDLSDLCFYTMPYVEGPTLKKILKSSSENTIGNSIQSLLRMFLNVCEAIAYIHSKNIVHRDLKPDNIIIGKFGEVLLLDWGIAKYIDQKDIKLKDVKREFDLTNPGKVTGTLAYMAPERALGENASTATDIYSLGAILYQILTLQRPFLRKDLKTFRKNYKLETLIEPLEKAPYRDIPQKLSDITKKCLSEKKEDRYQNVEDLIHEIKDYIEGKPDWTLLKTLHTKNKSDWELEENFLFAKHIAISQKTENISWLTLMIGKVSISGNMRLEAKMSLGKNSSGLGFLLNIPRHQQQYFPEEGYRIWLNTQKDKPSELFRSNVLIAENEKASLSVDIWHDIIIEKIDDQLNIYLDNNLIFSHTNHLPLLGTRFALGYKDTHFLIQDIKIYTSFQNVMVNCLAIPDAFFAKEQYDIAINEYKKIASSFSGRLEAKEAIFRSGLAYLEKAKKLKHKKDLFILALDEFEKLHNTPSAPLEYLGKSLVYAAIDDSVEEAKCLELVLRKYEQHHLISIIKEYIIYRMHESSYKNREAAYRIILIALRLIPNTLKNPDTNRLINNLKKNFEKLSFIEKTDDIKNLISIELAYRLNKPLTLLEIIESENLDIDTLQNAIFALIKLDYKKAEDILVIHPNELLQIMIFSFSSIEKAIENLFTIITKKISKKQVRVLIFLLEKLIENKKTDLIQKYIQPLKDYLITKEDKMIIDSILLKSYLLDKNYKNCNKIFDQYKTVLNDENLPFYFLYGIWLYLTDKKDQAKNHFLNILETSYPSSYSMASLYLISKSKSFIKSALFFEKKKMYLDLILFYECLGDKKKINYYKKLLK